MILNTNTDDYYKYCKLVRKKYSDIIFFNGVFDILHLGHIKMFNYLKRHKLRQKIICGINSDSSVKIQNKSHPLINTLDYRIKMIDCIFHDEYIDFIVFDTPTPCSVIWHIMPDVMIKGHEYEDKEFPEKMIMNKIGGKIEYYDSGIEMSTTKIIERVMNNGEA